MILEDANLLLYAYNQDDPSHAVARTWLQSEISSGRPLRPSQAPTAISTASTASRRSIRFSSRLRKLRQERPGGNDYRAAVGEAVRVLVRQVEADLERMLRAGLLLEQG